MPLTLLHGPAGAGKSTEILRLATQRNIHDPFPDSFFFIVPTASAAETIRQKFLALKKTPGLFIGEQVTTFDRFLLALLKNNLPRVHLAEMSFVRNLIRTLLFSNSYPSLEEIRPFASTPEALAATFLGLKRNGVGPEEARALFARHKTDRLKDFIQIFSDYQALISRLHYFDSGELTLSALKLLRRGELKLPQSVTSLYIDRLFPVTLGQREILKELVKNFPHLDVTLSYSFDYQSADDPHLYPAYGFLGELAETSRYFRGPSPGPQPALLRFANPAHEVQWLIRQIAETLSSGVMPEEIGVVLPSHPYYWEKLCGRKDPVAKSLSLSAAREDFEIAWNFENDLLEGKLAPSWKEDELKKIGPTPLPSPLGIKWLTLSEAPSFNFKKVFIVGFTASLFPELATDHPFFTPEMRQSPEMREILGNPAYQWNLAKNWLAQTLARSEEAVLTYPASLWGNREQLPSRLLACHPEPSLCHPEPQAKDLPSTPGRSFAFAQDDKPRDYPPLRKKTFSISELQTYQKCPFLYYARYHLKLGERFKEETDVAPDTAGSFVHRVLEKLLKLHFDLYRDALEYDLYQNRFLQTVPPLVAAEGERDTELLKIPKPLREIFLSRVSETVIRLMKKEFAALRSGKKKTLPAHLEWMFGKGGVPPLRLKTDDGELLISGRIDRIDASDKFFTVMDYKTGECDSISKIREGESFQIPLYVMAVSSLLYPDLKPAAGLLVSLGELSKSSGFALEGSTEEECLPKGNRITSEMLENMKQDLTAKIAGIAKKIQSGAFEPDPQSESLCRFCDYRDICHYGK